MPVYELDLAPDHVVLGLEVALDDDLADEVHLAFGDADQDVDLVALDVDRRGVAHVDLEVGAVLVHLR